LPDKWKKGGMVQMKLLELGTQLYNTTINKKTVNPFFPFKWTTALACYTCAAFPGLDGVLKRYNNPKPFYRENTAVTDFFNGLRLERGDGEFKIVDNVIYSNEIKNNQTVSTDFPEAGWQREVFFAMKNGYAIEGVPSEHVFILLKYAASGNLYSNLPVLYPSAKYKELTSGYIENPIDIISDVLNINYTPLSMDRLYVPSYTCGEDAMEVYLPAIEMVAVFPATLVEMLTIQDIFAVTLNKNILCLNEKPLHELCGKYGIYPKGALDLYNAG
jgi:hypothetical protein